LEIKVYRVKEIQKALQDVIKNIKDYELITKPLANLMRDYVHIDTSYLKGTIYHDGPIAGASAPYAGYEDDRGGSHAYGAQAIEAFGLEAYADVVVRPY
jgi:hypothetical protein